MTTGCTKPVAAEADPVSMLKIEWAFWAALSCCQIHLALSCRSGFSTRTADA